MLTKTKFARCKIFLEGTLVLLAPYQDGAKQGRRWKHATWSCMGRPLAHFPVCL